MRRRLHGAAVFAPVCILAGACATDSREFTMQGPPEGDAAAEVAATADAAAAGAEAELENPEAVSGQEPDSVTVEPASAAAEPEPAEPTPPERASQPASQPAPEVPEPAPEVPEPDVNPQSEREEPLARDGGTAVDGGFEQPPAEPLMPVIEAFEVSPAYIPPGAPTEVIVTWSVSEADDVALDVQGEAQPLSSNGNTFQYSVTKSTTFTLTATNAAGVSSGQVVVELGAAGVEDWTARFGSAAYDDIHGSALTPDGKVLVTGFARAPVEGMEGEARNFNFVGRYSTDGSADWFERFGNNVTDTTSELAVDPDGNVLSGGLTHDGVDGELEGGPDAWVGKFTEGGEPIWIQQWGETGRQRVASVAVAESIGVYATGELNPDAGFLLLYSDAGVLQWEYRFEKEGQRLSPESVASDGEGNALVAGSMYAEEDNGALLAKVAPTGALLWQKVFIGDVIFLKDVVTDAEGNVYTVGRREDDIVVLKLSAEGEELWTTSYGSSEVDDPTALALDSYGNLYVAGSTRGGLGALSRGNWDASLSKLTTHGIHLWDRQMGSSVSDGSTNILAVGATLYWIGGAGSLGPPTPGEWDGFITKLD